MSKRDTDLEAAFEAGLIETVRREAMAVLGANQTYPCGDVMAMKAEIDRLRAMVVEAAQLSAENEKLRAALTPSVDTKAAYIGEFSFPYTYPGEDGEEVPIKVTVPWTTIKEIMAAIRTRAALQDKSDESPEGN